MFRFSGISILIVDASTVRGEPHRLAATLNSLRGPFHVINYLGSACGGQILSPTAMTRLMDRTVQVLQRRLAGETDHSLNLAMHFPPTWDPYFQPTMSVADVYHFGTQHFDHHQRQLTLQAPEQPGLGIQLLVTSDCPHREAAEHLLRTALAEVGLPTKLRVLTVTEADDVALQGFAGSPTFRANKADLFPPARQPAGLSCRIYRTGSTSSGLPDLHDLRQALKHAADQAL